MAICLCPLACLGPPCIFRRWKSGIPVLLPLPVFTNFAEPELRQRALHCGYGDKHEYKRVVVDILTDMSRPACHV